MIMTLGKMANWSIWVNNAVEHGMIDGHGMIDVAC
jgi:hypothetical protein